MTQTTKVRINISLTQEARDLLREMADAKGISMNAALEIMIREAGQARKG